MTTDRDLLLGRALIAAAWADGELDASEREALEDLLLEIDQLSPDTWRALHADLDRPFEADHRERLFAELAEALADDEARRRAASTITAMVHRLAPESAEARVLDELAAQIATEVQTPAPGGLLARFGAALSGGLRLHSTMVRQRSEDERVWEERMRARLVEHWPAGRGLPDDAFLHRLCTGSAILAHVVRLDGSVDAGEIDALDAAIREQWGLDEASARLATDLVLDESAVGLDLHLLLRAFQRATTEDERMRFLAAVFRVAAGDGIATYDEIEEVRRIGRGLLLSHEHFIAAKLSVPGERRDT